MLQYEPSLGFGYESPAPIPSGNYLLKIIDTSVEPTKKAKEQGTGEQILVLTAVVEDAEYKERKIIININIKNNNEQAQHIGKQQFNSFCAVTQTYVFATQSDDKNAFFEFRGKYLRADIESDGKYNQIKAVYDVHGRKPGEMGAASPANAPVVSAAPPAAFSPPAMPTAPAPQPVAQPFAPPAVNAPAYPMPAAAPAGNGSPFPPAMPTGYNPQS